MGDFYNNLLTIVENGVIIYKKTEVSIWDFLK